MTRKLDGPMTLREVAALLGWEYEQTRRILHRLNEEAHGTLLRREPGFGQGVRWTVTRAALRKVRPEWFVDTRLTTEVVTELQDEVANLKRRLERAESAIGTQTRRMNRAGIAM